LARAYKRINAPVGELGLASLKVSTKALAGTDDTYNRLETQLSFITSLRNHLADEMLERLTAAEFHGERIREDEAGELAARSRALVDYVNWLAAH
jgi:HAMP domain-containing protein